ncbi:hypothetical protein PATSB16_38740 [Pandoraea thiooxydans]|nr:hypothetical protein [Pandoraea thiooxydans]APR97208.1 hypothetical protein PATSB16_38740 [Pandoraea thiooxydans]
MPADGWDAWGGSDGPVRIVIIMANKTLGTRQKLVFRDGQQKRVSPPRKQAPVPGPPASPWRTGAPHNAGAGPRQGANRRLCPWLPAASKDDVPQD